MLTEDNILRLYQEGVAVYLHNKPHPEHLGELWGLYDPELLRITAFIPSIPTPKDLDTLLLHEFVHARDDLLVFDDPSQDNAYMTRTEEEVQQEALETFEKYPEVLGLIKVLYHIK